MSLTNLNYSIYLLTTFAQCVAILILNTGSFEALVKMGRSSKGSKGDPYALLSLANVSIQSDAGAM